MQQGKRWVADGIDFGVPIIQQLGFDDLRHALGLQEHSHPTCFEFVFIEKGKAGWDIGDRHYETKTGDVFHTRPNEVHRGSYNVIEPCRLWWLALEVPSARNEHNRPELSGDWLLTNVRDRRLLLDGMRTLPRVVPMGQQMIALFWRMRNAIQKGGDLAVLEVNVLLMDFLLQLIARPEQNTAVSNDLFAKIERLQRRMESDLEWNPNLAELAESVNVSPSYFHRVFQQYTGLTPKSYAVRLKIAEAGRLLKETGLSVTEISLNLGFATTQHFATLFRRRTGMSPTDWRKAESERAKPEFDRGE